MDSLRHEKAGFPGMRGPCLPEIARFGQIHRSRNDARCRRQAENTRTDFPLNFPPASHFGAAAACRRMPATTGFRAHLPGVFSLIGAKKSGKLKNRPLIELANG